MRAKVALCLLALLAPAGCLTRTPVAESLWPPKDFYLEVRFQSQAEDGERERRRLRVWADGLVVWAEAPSALGGPSHDTDWFPVFCRLCAYRLQKASVRDLARRLELAGLRTIAPIQGDAEGQDMLVIHWRSFEDQGTIWARGQVHGAAARVVQLVNAFLPPGLGFELPELPADEEPPHVLYTPQPVDSVEGALAYHQELLHSFPSDPDLQVDTFALALAAGRRDEAERLLARLEAEAGEQALPRIFPGSELSSLTVQMRRLLQRTGG